MVEDQCEMTNEMYDDFKSPPELEKTANNGDDGIINIEMTKDWASSVQNATSKA